MTDTAMAEALDKISPAVKSDIIITRLKTRLVQNGKPVPDPETPALVERKDKAGFPYFAIDGLNTVHEICIKGENILFADLAVIFIRHGWIKPGTSGLRPSCKAARKSSSDHPQAHPLPGGILDA